MKVRIVESSAAGIDMGTPTCYAQVMPTRARIVIPGGAHYVSQMSNRAQVAFFGEEDYRAYLALLADWCRRFGVAIWAYCLLPQHVQLVLVPPTADAMSRALAGAHRGHTVAVNGRLGCEGNLWRARYQSFAVGPTLVNEVVREVELSPVRAGLVEVPWDYPWSSAAAHVARVDDAIVSVTPVLKDVDDWAEFLVAEPGRIDATRLRNQARGGLPLGDEAFIAELEASLGRCLRPGRRGRPPKPK